MKQPWLVGALTLCADQLTKWLVVSCFAPGQSLPMFPPLLYLTYVQNTGAAFGLFKGQQVLFILLAVGVIAYLVRTLLSGKPLAAVTAWGSALILGGAAGNLLDRLRLGYVIDFLDLRVWPVFNIGDSAITIGVVLLLWQGLHREKVPGT